MNRNVIDNIFASMIEDVKYITYLTYLVKRR